MMRPKEKLILGGLVTVFLCLVFAEWLLLGSTAEQRKMVAWVSQTNEVLQRLNQVVSGLSDAENGRRGYVLSGHDRYLLYHQNAVDRAQWALQRLRDLTKDDPRLTAEWNRLANLIERRIEIWTESIRAREERDLDVTAQIAFMEEGQQAMEPVRQLANQIIAEEGKLLEERQVSRDAKVKQIERLAFAVSMCALASFGILYVLFLRANKRRHRAETDLQKSNAELEQRVQDRTAELSHTVEKLERADEFRSKVMESAIFGVGALDLEGKFTLVNAQFESLMGYAPNELLGKPYSILLSPQNDAELRPMFHQVLRDNRPLLDREIDVIKKDGSVASVVFGWSALLTKGEVRGVVGTVLDITDLKKMEHALRESEHRVRMIIDTALDGVIIIDSAGYITGWNPQAEKMFGWSEREIVGKRLSESIIPKRFREAHEWGLKNYAMNRTGPVLNRRIEMIALNRNGEEFSVELAITPMQFGSSTSFSAFVRNITERKRVEARVQAQLFRLDLLRTTTRAIGERLDLASIFQVVVKSLEQHLPIDFGCVCLYEPQEETLRVASVGEKSQSIASRLGLVNQAFVQIDDNGLARCIHGELVYEPDVALVPASFPRRLAEGGLRSLIIAPLIVESKVFGVLVAARRKAEAFTSGDCEFLRQLSEHVALAAHHSQLHAALQNAYDELRQTQQSVMQQERLRAIGQMASGIAHDINNGLSPVAVYTELLLETEATLSNRARDYLTTIQRGVDDVAQTVARMRDFSRNRETQLALTDIDLNEAVQQVLDLTRVRWKNLPQERGLVIDVQTKLAPIVPAIKGAESEIRDGITNLVLNAIDAMPNGGRLTLATRAVNGSAAAREVQLEVTDTGLGMDEETRRRCLEPFFSTKGERGTGLGLAMVYGMVQRHAAEIEIESAPGEGTTVRMTFPANAADSADAAPAPVRSDVRPNLRLRLLVIDDDPLLIKSVRDMLENDGHSVTTADGGQAGIDAFQSACERGEPFSVVMTDLGMPHVDGRKVSAFVKAMAPTTPVILVTGWGRRMLDSQDIPLNVDRVLSKPPRLREIREALADCVRIEAGI